MAKLFLGTREVTPAVYKDGYTELPSYQVVNGVASRRSGALTGNEFSDITSVGYRGMYYSFYYREDLSGPVDFSSLTSVGNYGLAGCFYYTSIRLKDGNLSALVTVGDNGLSNAGLKVGSGGVLDISALTSIGTSGLAYTFEDSNMLTTVYLTSLTNLGSKSMEFAFRKCIKLKDIYFNSLTTTSFGSYTNQFDHMLYMTGESETHTLHFPSNLTSTISGLTGYPTFNGTSGYVTLAFDLPATS